MVELRRMTSGSAGGWSVKWLASNTTIVSSVPLARVAARCEPSGDHVGKPKVPLEASASSVAWPRSSTSSIEPSFASTASVPVEAMGVSVAVAGEASELGAGDPAGTSVVGVPEVTPLTDGAGLPDGLGPPQAVTTIATSASAEPASDLIA